jgi:phage portal protein BeeE
VSWLRTVLAPREEARDDPLAFQDWVNYFAYNGLPMGVMGTGGTPGGDGEMIEANFRGYVDGAMKSNGVVFACMVARLLLFSEARFQFRRRINGRPGDLFGTAALGPLETPWERGTTGDLLARMITDVDLAGNFYGVRRGNSIRRLRPDWVTIVTGSKSGSPMDTETAGYLYQDGGPASGNDREFLLPEFVCHWAPIPDPIARVRGMSWLQPIVEEIMADKAAMSHKRRFFDGGAQLGYVVTLDPDGKMNPEQFKQWVSTFKHGHEGVANAYKTLFLSAGADVKVVGADLKSIDFTSVQGHGETRICAAARVPAIIAGVSEGLDSATYSNYAQARRAFGDLTMRPLWRTASAALAPLVSIPGGAELWYDSRDIPFLAEDVKDEAEVQQMQASTITMLVREGFTAESAKLAVMNGDMSLLDHTGLLSVQLQEPGVTQPDPALPAGNGAIPALNGSNGRRLLEQFVSNH